MLSIAFPHLDQETFNFEIHANSSLIKGRTGLHYLCISNLSEKSFTTVGLLQIPKQKLSTYIEKRHWVLANHFLPWTYTTFKTHQNIFITERYF
jgi:hypothetical protein